MVSSVNNVGTISSAGLGSGLDVASIVSQLMKIERQPLDALESAATKINSKLSTFGKLQSYFSALRDKSNDLTSTTLWSAMIATSGDSAAVKVSAGTGAVAGSYAVQVAKLASGQTLTTTALPSATSDFSAGALTIELGTWTGDPATGFTAKSGATPVTIDIADSETSLTAVRDKINAAGAGVVASIVNDASGARLSIRSKDTGAENGFRITATETFDDGSAGAGLSMLAYDAAGGASQMTRARSASDALATVNGISVTSKSNTLADVVDGLTITLLKEGASTDLTVANDADAIKQKITDFVSAFNDLAGFLQTQTAYDATTKTAGTLQGDQGVTSLQRQLRAVLNQATSASGTWSRLSEIGVTMNASGKLEIAGSKLDNALGNLTELKELLATNGADSASSGFMRRWKELADAVLGTGGALETRTEALKANLSSNEKSQDLMQQRLDRTEARLRAQYQTLDAQMSSLNGLSNYITQQINAFNKTSS